MTNTEILKHVTLAGLHPDDLVEVLRIFEVLTDDKKIAVLARIDSIVENIKRHREDMEREKEILLVQALEDIERDLEVYNRKQVQKTTKQEMEIFQKNI